MRKPRVILFDDDRMVLDVWRNFFLFRRYEVLAYTVPAICPIYGEEDLCTKPYPCSDVMVTNYSMPRMNGIELLQAQARLGCKLTPGNKALISGDLQEDGIRIVRSMGVAYFEKPLEFGDLGRWLDECESRVDLRVPVAIRRKEERTSCRDEVLYQLGAGPDISRGIMLNRSTSGFCMKVSTLLPPDHSVTLHQSHPLATSSAIIRWTRAIARGAYLIGLQRH